MWEEWESSRYQDSVESKFPLEIRQGPNVGENSAFPPGFSRDRHKSRESGLRYALIGSGRVMALAVSAHRSPRGEM